MSYHHKNRANSIICGAPREHVDGHDPCGYRKPYGSPWSVMTMTIMGQEDSFEVVSMTENSQLRMRGIESFCGTTFHPPHLPPPPTKKKQSRKEAIEEFLKTGIKTQITDDGFGRWMGM